MTLSEDRLALDDVGFVRTWPHDVVHARGPEATAFLQRMLSNDVAALAADAGCRAALLEDRGRMVADLVVLAEPDGRTLVTDPGRGAVVAAFLGRYHIMEKLTLTPAVGATGGGVSGDPAAGDGAWEWLGVAGGRAAQTLERVLGGRSVAGLGRWHTVRGVAGGAPVRVIAWRPLGVPVFALGCAGADAAAVARALVEAGAREVGDAAWEVLRIEAGAPRWGAELDETTIPQEAALEEALSFSKGCYLGQETIARLDARGNLSRRVTALAFDGPVEAGAALRVRGDAAAREVGRVTSVCVSPRLGVVGLGWVHRSAAGAALEAGGVAARVREVAGVTGGVATGGPVVAGFGQRGAQ